MFLFELSGNPNIIRIGQTTRSGFWRNTPTQSPDHILLIARQGNGMFYINEIEYFLSPGDILFIPANYL